MKHKGFTLAEVLMALALLGIIAAFAIPKILQSTENTKRIAILKEAVAALYNIQEEGRLKSTLTPTNMQSFFVDRANALKVCDSNSQTQGCWDLTTPGVETNGPGFILANGAVITGLDNCCATTTTLWENGLMIDWNGLKAPNKLGEDQLWLVACYGTSPCTTLTVTPQVPGSLHPLDLTASYTNRGYTATDNTNNSTLFQQVSQ